MKSWAISAGATVASTYALDAFAALAGANLVASGLLAGLDHRAVLAFLAASYVVWAFGLRASLRANGTLLATTGTSTNVFSKAAYDLTRRLAGDRASRVAAAVAYTGTEVVKEVPYYTAAFGAAVFTDSITADEALIFLGGANLGAALYEGGLARLTRAHLGRSRRRCSGTSSLDGPGLSRGRWRAGSVGARRAAWCRHPPRSAPPAGRPAIRPDP